MNIQSSGVMRIRKRRGAGFSWTPWLFILPFILSFFVFFVIPAVYSLVLSLFQYRGYGAAKFVGLRNYVALFRYAYFWSTLQNVLFYYIGLL